MNRIALVLMFLVPVPLCAQEYKKTVNLTITPAGAPSPALRYVLLPPLGDLKPGNAAYWYQRTANPESVSNILRHPDYAKIGDWLDLPLDQFPRQKAAAFLLRGWSEEIDFAARHQQCDWHLVERLKKDGFMLPLPDVHFFRQYARFLGIRARFQILAGDYEKAIRTIQTGFALAQHVAEGPTLIHGLVGAAVANIILDRVEDLIQRPNAPNLYWALTQLPRPFNDFRKGFGGERLMADHLLPGMREALANPARPPMSSLQIQAVIDKLSIAANAWGMRSGRNKALNRLFVAVASAKMYPHAIEMLKKRGFTKVQIDRLPVVQAAFMQTLVEYDRIYHNSFKWVFLPYPQAQQGLRKADEAIRQSATSFSSNALIPFGENISPAFRRIVVARVLLDRRFAVLRQIEALRQYAHDHGQFPEELAKMQDATPLPVDPMTGKHFRYELTKPGEAVILMSPPPGEAATERNSIRWVLKLRPSPSEPRTK